MCTTGDRVAVIAPEGRSPEEWFSMGMACLGGRTGARDYEQAAFCLLRARTLGHPEAAAQLDVLSECGKGVVVERADAIAPTAVADVSEAGETRLPTRVTFQHSPDRCPSCGARVFRRHPRADGSYVCAPDEGGCGARLYIPIAEAGLCRGFAIQQYKERQHPVVYSYMGRCVHKVKYDKGLSETSKRGLLDEVVNRMRECCVVENLLGTRNPDSVLITPAPSSVYRRLQPVRYLSQGISEGVMQYAELLRKRSTVESKNRQRGTELEDGDVTCTLALNGMGVLLVDDTYGEGATLRACIKALKRSGAGEVYYLSLCKNTYGGMKGRK